MARPSPRLSLPIWCCGNLQCEAVNLIVETLTEVKSPSCVWCRAALLPVHILPPEGR